MTIKYFSFSIYLVITLIFGALQSSAIAQPEFCWKDSYGRGAGTIPGQPPKGQYRHWFSANWYSCPKGYDRSLNPDITAPDACIKTVKHRKPSGSFSDPRQGGQYWSCNGWNRTAYAVTTNKACSKLKRKSAKFIKNYKRKKPSGSFYDPRKGGEYWSCGGWKRTWSAVTASDACVQGGWFSKTKKATYKGKAHNSKPSGSFYDPRKGGQYWSCGGWNRTVYSVTGKNACEREALKGAQLKGQHQTITKTFASRRGSVCGSKQEQAGLCYNKCKKGYDAVGPVCWGTKAPAKNWVHCGAGFARTKAICGMVIGTQVMAALEVASFVATAGASSTTTGAAKAAAKKTEKAQKAAKWAAANKNKAKILAALKKAKAAGETVAAYDGAYKSLSNATTEEDVVRAAAEIAALADPTGVSSAVAAYTFPVCAKYKSKGAFEKKTKLSGLQMVAKKVTGSKKTTSNNTNGAVNTKTHKPSGKINVPWKNIAGGLTDIGVGANGVVWGVNKNQDIYRLKSNGKSWQKIKGKAVRIDVDPKGNAVVVNKSGTPYQWNGKKWLKLPGVLSDISVGPRGDIWGINNSKEDGPIYKYNDRGAWLEANGSANKAISVGPKGPWVINKNNQIYTGSVPVSNAKAKASKKSSKASNQVIINPNACKAAAKAKGLKLGGLGYKFEGSYTTKGCYAYKGGKYKGRAYFGTGGTEKQMTANPGGGKYRISFPSSKKSSKRAPTKTTLIDNRKKINVPWKNIAGGLTDIGVGANGVVWGVNKNMSIYRLRSNNTWENIRGGLKRIDVDNRGNAYGVNRSDHIYKWTGKGGWRRIPGALTDIGVGANGVVWGVNKNQDIYRLKSDGKSWQKIKGKAVRIDVDPKGNAVVVNKSGTPYQWNGKKWLRLPGVLHDISVGPKGKIWGINNNGAIYKYNGKGGWIRANGSANKAISVGPKGPWVINKNSQIYRGSK